MPRAGLDRRLALGEILDGLVADKLVDSALADGLRTNARLEKSVVHPLVTIANEKWRAQSVPRHPLSGKLLLLEGLTEWFAGKTQLPYFHIDPLKVNITAVTDVMSSAYAERFKILPVESKPGLAVIATAEPYVREWEHELAGILRVEIKRVFANPLDLSRYVVEFYNLARSIIQSGRMPIAGPSARRP